MGIKRIKTRPCAMRGRVRGGILQQRLEISKDCICNSLTTVQKDFLFIAKVVIDENKTISRSKASDKTWIYRHGNWGGVADLLYPSSEFRRGRVQGDGTICPTIPTTMGICRVMDKEMLEEKLNKENVEDYLVNGFGIFKLSARECMRLMNVQEKDIDKMLSINSKTQCYRQAGNSIIVSVLMAIFSQLNIKGVTPWNELTDDERYELIYKGCEIK